MNAIKIKTNIHHSIDQISDNRLPGTLYRIINLVVQ